MVTEPVVWSMTPLIVSTRPLSAYMVPSMSCNCTFGIFSRISLVLPPSRICDKSWRSVMEKQAYISEMSATVVSGLATEGLTKLPTRQGMLPTTPSLGLVTLVYDKLFLALTNWALACASCAFVCASWFSAICKSQSLMMFFLFSSRLLFTVSSCVFTAALAVSTAALAEFTAA